MGKARHAPFAKGLALHDGLIIGSRFESGLGEVVRQMALDGHGIALLADWHVGDDLRSGKLLEAFADWTVEPSSGIYAVYPSREKYRAHRPKLYRSSQGMDGDPPD